MKRTFGNICLILIGKFRKGCTFSSKRRKVYFLPFLMLLILSIGTHIGTHTHTRVILKSGSHLSHPAPFSPSRSLKINSDSVLLSSKGEMDALCVDRLRHECVGDRGGPKMD